MAVAARSRPQILMTPILKIEQHVAFPTDSSAADFSSAITMPAAAATTTTTTMNNIPMLPTTSAFNMASLKSCYFQVPRFTSGQEATET